LKLLGYKTITDIDVDKNPQILSNYEKVIVLHNEYVTQNEFDAITNHPNVLYLYPNAMYAKITANYENDTITLVRGHNYPSSDIRNGFGWEYDNSELEYNILCADWKFVEIKHGRMLNCYPENIIFNDLSLLKAIKDIPPNPVADKNLVEDQIKEIPSWIRTNAKWFADGSITESDFTKGIEYLIKKGVIEIPNLPQASEKAETKVPSWIKNNAKWWYEGKITDADFVKGIQYLVKHGVIRIS
jgi:hypothetical protein